MAPPDTTELTKAQLEEQAHGLGIDTSGMNKAEIADAIEEVNPAPELDADGSDDSGRPPLAQVAQERHEEGRVTEIVTPDPEGDDA